MALSVRHVHLILQRALKEREDPKLITYAEQQRKDGFGWRCDGLGDWSTDDVFTKLRDLGIDTDADRFCQQAENAQSCKNLREGWRETVDLEDSPWDDFPFLASEELWRRLAPDLVCPEFVADRLSAVISTLDDPGRVNLAVEGEDIAVALQTVAYLERFPSAERAARFDELLECTTYDVSGWLLEFVVDNAEEHMDAVVRVADVMSDADPENAANYQGDLAIVLATAGDDVAARERVRTNLERFPHDVWIRIKAGDAYEASGRYEDALHFYVEAMHRADKEYDWDGAEDRLLPVLRRLGREREYSPIIRACACVRVRVTAGIEKRLNQISKTTSKLDFAAGLARIAAPAQLAATALNFAADATRVLNTEYDHWSDRNRDLVGSIPIVGDALVNLTNAIIEADPAVKAMTKSLEELNALDARRTTADKFIDQLDDELRLRRELANASDAANVAIIRARDAEKKALAEVDAQMQKLSNTNRSESNLLSQLAERRVEIERTTQLEIDKLADTARNQQAQEIARHNQAIEDAAMKRGDMLMDIEFRIQQATLRAAGDTETALLEAIRHRSDIAIAEAKRAGDAERVEALKRLRLVEQQEALSGRKKDGRIGTGDLTPDLQIQTSRLGRIAQDPGARAAQQIANNTQQAAKLQQQAVTVLQQIQRQTATRDGTVEASL